MDTLEEGTVSFQKKVQVDAKGQWAFKVLKMVNNNAYKVNLLGDYGVSATFNVVDLSPYIEDDHLVNLREKSPQQGEDDGGPSKGPH